MVCYLNIEARWDGAPDQGLLQKMGGRGFPYCVIMNPKGEVIWEVRPSDEDTWNEGMKDARNVAELQQAVAAGTGTAAQQADLALLQALGCQQRQPGALDELEKHAATEGVNPKILERFRAWLPAKKFELAYRGAVTGVSRQEAPKRLLALYKDGLRPPKGNRMGIGFYQMTAVGALQANDLETARRAIAEFEQALKDAGITNDRAKQTVERMKQRLAQAEGKAEGDEQD